MLADRATLRDAALSLGHQACALLDGGGAGQAATTSSGGRLTGTQTVPLTKVNRCLAEGRDRLRQLGAMD
jgi:hypothetical protein